MRHYKRKSNRDVALPVILQASKQVIEEGISFRRTALNFNIPRTSLLRFVKKMREAKTNGTQLPTVGYRNNRQIFNEYQESELVEYLLQAGLKLDESYKQTQGNASENNKISKMNKKHNKGQMSKRKFSMNIRDENEKDDEDCGKCFYCLETAQTSIDDWIQCTMCKRWAHEACAGVDDDDLGYECEFC